MDELYSGFIQRNEGVQPEAKPRNVSRFIQEDLSKVCHKNFYSLLGSRRLIKNSSGAFRGSILYSLIGYKNKIYNNYENL